MTAGLSLPSPKTARLPAVYAEAKESLAKCYRLDECKTWANKADAIASYARQAEDDAMLRMAMSIKARAIERCGALLKEIDAARGGDRGGPMGGRPPVGETRSSAAREAGLSPHQKKQAIRVATFHEKDPVAFERAVERSKPATVTELARMGTKPSTSHLRGRDPKDFAMSTRGQGALKRFVVETEALDVLTVARGALPDELAEMEARLEAASDWIRRLSIALKNVRD